MLAWLCASLSWSQPLLNFPGGQPERVQQTFVSSGVQGLADQGNWRELEAVLDGYLQKRVHLEDSSSALALAYESCHTKDSFLEQWIQARPNSVHAHVARAYAYAYRAWEARGTDIKAAREADFVKNLTLGEQECQSALKLGGDQNPALYGIWLSLGRGAGYSPQRQKELWLKAVELDPYFLNAYCEYSRGLVPRWGGSQQALDQMLLEAQRKTQKGLGSDGAYALVCSYLLDHLAFIREEVRLDLPRCYRGFDELERKYPASYRFGHYHLRVCQLAMDMTEVKKMLARLGSSYVHSEANSPRGVIEPPATPNTRRQPAP